MITYDIAHHQGPTVSPEAAPPAPVMAEHLDGVRDGVWFGALDTGHLEAIAEAKEDYLLVGWSVGPGLHFLLEPGLPDRPTLVRLLRDAVSLAEDVTSLETWVTRAAAGRGLHARLIAAGQHDLVFDLT